ncbi:MAG: NAD(+)/NADH kinase [Lachnospiraceae bacterium]|jgi:NAD+ kinase|nr:NAD(+)/NADH kinase [Lachnospiraceae bacterium]MDY2945507.1 NAD(+)/NADH kinase [Lachnospiraceae bacterium]MDY6342066.1 NAD(+)/NADH kinase [Lachnospiraceae bacterium]
MNNFFIISNRMKDPDFEFGGKVRDYLVSRGASCTEAFGDPDGKQVAPEKTDLIIVLGGDGTMLKAADDNAGGRVPLLGINLGQLGYMAEIEKEGWKEALDSVLSGDYEIEERMMLEGRSARTGETMEALNDIVITRAGKLQVVGIDVYVNGQFLNRYEADGIIVSTPTGSTAYNLSAGGPIVEPQARLILMTPICAHTLNTRTIIFSPNDTIEMEIGAARTGKQAEVDADFDGDYHSVRMKTGERMRIRVSAKTTRILRVKRLSFLEVLHRKMSV